MCQNKQRPRLWCGYNAQTVVDRKYGLTVNTDVVSENNDVHQFVNQIEQANETLGKKNVTLPALIQVMPIQNN